MKINASMEQSYRYYTGNDGSADKKVIPQVWPFLFHMIAFSHHFLTIWENNKRNAFLLKASGAYVFRPNGSYPIKSEEQVCIILQDP